MQSIVVSALAFVVTLGVLIAFHELGHFWVARRLGVKVLRFSIGFGKPLWLCRYGPDQTEYVLAAIPLGGYVKMLDEREGDVAPHELHRAFNRQPVGKRIAIVAAGPIFNLVLAVVAYWGMFIAGVPGLKPLVGAVTPNSAAYVAGIQSGDEIVAIGGKETPTWDAVRIELLDAALDGGHITLAVRQRGESLHDVEADLGSLSGEFEQGNLLGAFGVEPYRLTLPPVIGALEPGSAAESAGLLPGDRLIAADGVSLGDWTAWVEYVRARPQQAIALELERNGERVSITLTPVRAKSNGTVIGRIGAAPQVPPEAQDLSAELRYGPLAAVGAALVKTWQMSEMTLRMIGKMLVGDISVDNLSGPITIATYAGYSASVGVGTFLSFLAIISISLGVLNLLPIPLLDGGHLMYYIIELFKGKPLSDATQLHLQRVGMVLLMLMMMLALYNDLQRLFAS